MAGKTKKMIISSFLELVNSNEQYDKITVTDLVGKCGISRQTFYDTDQLTQTFLLMEADLLVLAGFLWLLPPALVEAFPQRIINIHPALLPKYGGKGMYGDKVHEAVVAAGEPFSGITIHYVNEHYDEGDILFQEKIALQPGETAASLAARIHELEHNFYPKVIEKWLKAAN